MWSFDVWLFRGFNLISCERKPRWFCMYPDLCRDRLDNGIEVYIVEGEDDLRSAQPVKEMLHTANGDTSNFSFSFYLFACIYWWIHSQKVVSVTLIIRVLYVPYYFIYTSRKKGCCFDFHVFLWHKNQFNICCCFPVKVLGFFSPTFL